MEIKNRLFSYPVLCSDTDDYIPTTEFALESSFVETIHELHLEYEYIVSCNSLETLLRKGLVQYVLHIECSNTSFRHAIRSDIPHIKYSLPKSRVRGRINLVAMIVARVDIPNYSSAELNDDYASEIVSFQRGAILAYQNLPAIFVTKKLEDFVNRESFFTVIKQVGADPEELRPLTFNLYHDKIQILVDARTYEAFVRYQHSQSIALALLVLPALTFMITEVKDDPSPFMQYRWFQQLEGFYRANGKDFIEEVLQQEENPVNIAQEMLQTPVSKAYRELYAMESRE